MKITIDIPSAEELTVATNKGRLETIIAAIKNASSKGKDHIYLVEGDYDDEAHTLGMSGQRSIPIYLYTETDLKALREAGYSINHHYPSSEYGNGESIMVSWGPNAVPQEERKPYQKPKKNWFKEWLEQ